MSDQRPDVAQPGQMVAANQSHCVNCGQHVIYADSGEWIHTLMGIAPCKPAWRPRRRHLRLA